MDTFLLALRVLLSLAAVLGVIWYVQRRMSRGTTAQKNKTITVVGRQGVGSKASVALVDVDGKRFLLGVTEHAVTILHTADAPVAPAEAFSRVLTTEAGDADESAETGQLGIRPAVASSLAGSILSADTWRRAFASLKP